MDVIIKKAENVAFSAFLYLLWKFDFSSWFNHVWVFEIVQAKDGIYGILCTIVHD